MIGQREIIILVGTLAIIGGAFAYGVHKGTVWQAERYAEEKAELQEEIFDLAEDLSERAAEIRRLQAERQELINELENEALNAEGADAPGVATTGGLRRLERRWGPSPTATD
ncbi:hypothetical protein RDp07_gp64 [Roseobacter phage RD-1410Ws-07]|uniref:Uncharacterized protein n=2 Tax=Sanyabayvirus DS1410Ws06 TaxID=2844087 RepID=A0A191VYT7_9CAUD|nr:hypothetical protein HYO98_gp67 [Dinoroseobacter phage DS-1410Ws-06]ANJ20724.1 hypothetical protein DSp06_gp67 [Dinoroseobacter phage DS-1410Ws-06]ANJ20875.1 hypothetical protein RDp07_gp64 [Roseobacter phage RD-1410Ws-07]